MAPALGRGFAHGVGARVILRAALLEVAGDALHFAGREAEATDRAARVVDRGAVRHGRGDGAIVAAHVDLRDELAATFQVGAVLT
jgi:hypothetical protein